MALRDILSSPAIYQAFQRAGGFFEARLRAIDRYLPLNGNERVIDVGCGPGAVASRLPAGIDYVGYDPDPAYIAHAVRWHGKRGRFELGYFDEAAAAKEGKADVVMLNGVLHHMTDDEVRSTARTAALALKHGGCLFALEPCFAEGQTRLGKFLAENDRGRHVRTIAEYTRLLTGPFARIEQHVDHKLSWVPYTFAVLVARGPVAQTTRPSPPPG